MNKKAVLLINLGSPDSPEVKDVKKYLAEFLMDEKVIDIQYILRFLLVRGIIVNTRSKNSAKAYASIWTDEGSPLIINSENLRDACEVNSDVPLFLAMRYGNPSIKNVIQKISDEGYTEVLAIPLYPQYAMSTTESTIIEVKRVGKSFPHIKFDFIDSFYTNEVYKETLLSSLRTEVESHDYDHILFSYHGIPERHIYKTDPYNHCKINDECCNESAESHKFCYRHQSFEITKNAMADLGVDIDFSSSFQSRLGRDEWLKPYTAEKIAFLAQQGIKNLLVLCPSFVADCLETLEEIAIEGSEIFEENGGHHFKMLPCLNDNLEPVITDLVEKWN